MPQLGSTGSRVAPPVTRRSLLLVTATALGGVALAACGAGAPAATTSSAASSAPPSAAVASTSSAATSSAVSSSAVSSSAAASSIASSAPSSTSAASSTTASSSAAPSSSAASAAASLPKAAAGSLLLLLEADDNQKKVWQQVVDAFHQAVHKPQVELSNPSDIYTKFDTMLAGNAGPDLFAGFETKQLPHYVGVDAALNMDPYMSRSSTIKPDAFFKFTWSKHVLNGHLSAMPTNNAPLGIFYNEDMFREAGVTAPPAQWGAKGWDYAAFLDAAHKLTKTSGAAKAWFSSWSTWWLYCYPFVWGNGGHLFNSDVTQVLVDSPEVISTYQWLADLTWKEHVQPTPDEVKANKPDFIAGTLAISGCTENCAPPYLQKITSFKWNAAAVPSGTSGVWTRDPSNSAIAWKGTKQPDATWELAEFMGGDVGQLIIGLGGNGVPSRVSAAKSDKFLHQPNGVNWQVFVDAIDHEGIQPVTDIFPKMDDLISKQTAPLWANQASAQQVMTTLKPLLEELLKSAKFRRDRGQLWQQHGWAAATS